MSLSYSSNLDKLATSADGYLYFSGCPETRSGLHRCLIGRRLLWFVRWDCYVCGARLYGGAMSLLDSEREWWDEDSGYRVLVETERGGTVELLAEPGRVLVRLEQGDRLSQFSLAPGAAANIGRRLQGAAKHAQEAPAR